jgi:hypothetical protein
MHSVSPSEAPPGDLDDKLWVKTGRMVGSSVVASYPLFTENCPSKRTALNYLTFQVYSLLQELVGTKKVFETYVMPFSGYPVTLFQCLGSMLGYEVLSLSRNEK